MSLHFAFLVLEEHPYGREMLRILLERGFRPGLIIEEVSSVADEERQKFLARIAGQPMPPTITELIAGLDIPRQKVGNHNDLDCREMLEAFGPEVVVLGGTRIIRPATITIPRQGMVNAHPGLLPWLRGSSSVGWALYKNMPIGSTVHFIEESIDTGPIILWRQLPVRRGETYEGIVRRMLTLSGQLMAETLALFDAGKVLEIPQDTVIGETLRVIPPELLEEAKTRLAEGRYSHFEPDAPHLPGALPLKDMAFEPGAAFARRLDAEDELASFRDGFVVAEPDLIYMDGNSLGRLPRQTVGRVQTVVEAEWGRELIRGWNAGWFEAPARVGEKIARLVGAGPGQVVVSDSTSVNLFKLVMAALALRPGRERIVSDVMNFPSDLYILQGCIRLLGDRHHLHLVPSADGVTVDQQTLFDAIDERTALVTLSHVTFKSGFLYDAAVVTERAHQVGALVLWDLSHSAGAVPMDLDRWGVDLAVGCTYKYLNGGPGSPAFLYVRRGLQEEALSPIWGWFGQRSPFAFDLEYEPVEGIDRFLVGTPPTISLLAMEPALDLSLEAGLERIRRKSVRLTSYLTYLADSTLAPLGFTIGSPRDPAQRGSHVSVRHPEGYRINRALIEEMAVIPDFREPDNIRLGLAPLYTSFAEVWEAVDRIRRTVEEGRHLRYSAKRLAVT